MFDSSDKTKMTLERLEEIIGSHKPHPKSLLDEESKEAYNEEAAEIDFGNEFFEKLRNQQKEFKGDWWHLALLINNLDIDKEIRDIKDKERLKFWNKWHAYNINISGYDMIHLEHANLMAAHLEHAKLNNAHLEHADLYRAHLEHAYLYDTHLEHAKLDMAHLEHANLLRSLFEHANLEDAHLEHANLQSAYLEHAVLRHAHLEHANLDYANLEHANVYCAHFENANLSNAHLEHVYLSSAHLEHTKLFKTNLDRADVRGATGLRFDRNRVEGIDIEGNAPDPWSVLRRKYTGPLFFVHLLLLIVFFVPYAADAFYLSSVSNFQTWLVEEYDIMKSKIPDVKLFHQYNDELKRRIAEDMEEISAWRLLLGLQDGVWSISFGFVFIVIVYNGLRGGLTLRVSSLRDAEERSHITPALKEYWPLFRCHQVTKYLWYVAMLVVVANTGHWLIDTKIHVPKKTVQQVSPDAPEGLNNVDQW